MQLRNLAILLLVIAVIVGVAAYFTVQSPLLGMIKQGLDLQGGTHIVLEAVDKPGFPVTDQAMESAKQIITERVNNLGVSEPVIQREGARRIIVELAGVKDPEEAIRVVGQTAVLEFREPDGKTIIVSGKDLVDASERISGQGGGYVVSLKFNAEGAKKFADATARLVNQNIGIYLDDRLLQNPRVNEPIPSGEAVITGYPTLENARRIAIILKSGALPVNLEVRESRSVSATLGADSIAESKLAAAIGIGAVLLFMIALYRGPGLVADFALGVYVYLLLASMVAINAVLTLPGIAGIILSIGMAVDANVLIFERIREELNSGKTLRSGIAAGFHRAYLTIVDSNLTTLIAAGILYYFGTGPIRGFAVTLGIGVMISMFTAITLTRVLINLIVETNLVRKSFFGARG